MSAKLYTSLFFSIFIYFCFSFSTAHSQSKQLNWIGHWKDEGKRTDLITEVKKEFEFLNPNVHINFVYGADLQIKGENYKRKAAHTIVEMIRTGDIKWDVVFMDLIVYNYVAEILNDPFWGPKHLVDFGKVPGFPDTQKDFIVTDYFYRNQMGGILTGPFTEGYFFSFCYNKTVEKKIGLVIKKQQMDVNDLLTYAKKLSEYNKTNNTAIPLIRLGAWNRIESLFEYLFKSQFDNVENAISQSFSEEKKKAFLTTLLIFEKLGEYQPAVNNDHRSLKWHDWKNGFLENDGLFITGGSFMYNHLKVSGIDYTKVGLAEYPFAKKPNGLVGNYTPIFAVMKNSPNIKAAMDLMALWSEPKIAEKWVTYTRNPTGVKGNLDQPVLDALAGDTFNQFVKEVTERYKNLPIRHFQKPSYVFGKNTPVSASDFRENLSLILEGKLTATQFFNDVLKKYNE